jgi:hypothetical protein
MRKSPWGVIGLVVIALCWPGKALPQTSSPDALAAAKELILETKVADQIKLVAPMMLQQLKPLVTRGNPLVEKDFDALIPLVTKVMNDRLGGFLDAAAQIYAGHFTAEELNQVLAFYRTPTGQKFLRQLPELTQETMTLGQQFGQAVGQDIQRVMTEELRKRGHNI